MVHKTESDDITALDDHLRITVAENVNIDQIAKQQGLYM